jgi:putative membrane protein
MYFLIKSLHLLFVVAWMSAVFYLVNLAEDGGQPAVRDRLVLMGRRLYRFGHTVFGLAVLLGLGLWLHYGIGGGWLHAKLALVVVLLAYFIWTGVMLKRAAAGGALPSSKRLRLVNELPVLLLLPVIWLVLAKPF